MIFFVNKTREERRCKNTTSNSMLERKKHRIRTIYGGPRSFAKKEENSLAVTKVGVAANGLRRSFRM